MPSSQTWFVLNVLLLLLLLCLLLLLLLFFYILYDLIRVVRVRGRGPDGGHDGNPLGGLLRGAGGGTARHRDNTYFGPRH